MLLGGAAAWFALRAADAPPENIFKTPISFTTGSAILAEISSALSFSRPRNASGKVPVLFVVG